VVGKGKKRIKCLPLRTNDFCMFNYIRYDLILYTYPMNDLIQEKNIMRYSFGIVLTGNILNHRVSDHPRKFAGGMQMKHDINVK